MFDRDRSGSIGVSGLQEAMKVYASLHFSEEIAKGLIDEFDAVQVTRCHFTSAVLQPLCLQCPHQSLPIFLLNVLNALVLLLVPLPSCCCCSCCFCCSCSAADVAAFASSLLLRSATPLLQPAGRQRER